MKQAFTLIELLVVVLIIGILAAIALPQYQKAVWKSRLSTIKALTRSLADAEEVYYMENGKYTNDFEALGVSAPAPSSSSMASNAHVGTSYYYYDWGQCKIATGGTNEYVDCTLYKNGANYIGQNIKFKHSEVMVGTWCIAYTQDDLSTKICQLETGKNHVDDGTTYHMWSY